MHYHSSILGYDVYDPAQAKITYLFPDRPGVVERFKQLASPECRAGEDRCVWDPLCLSDGSENGIRGSCVGRDFDCFFD